MTSIRIKGEGGLAGVERPHENPLKNPLSRIFQFLPQPSYDLKGRLEF